MTILGTDPFEITSVLLPDLQWHPIVVGSGVIDLAQGTFSFKPVDDNGFTCCVLVGNILGILKK